MRACWFWIGDINWHISKVSYMQLPLRVPKTILSANLCFSRECIFIPGSVETYFASVLSHIFEQQHYNRQNNLTSLKQQQHRPPFFIKGRARCGLDWEETVADGLRIQRHIELQKQRSEPIVPPVQIVPGSNCLSFWLGVWEIWVRQCALGLTLGGWVGLANGHCAASWVSILGKQSVGVQVAETTGDVNSGVFLKPVFGVGFGIQVQNANIWILFLSCQDPEEDRAVGAKDDKQVVFADLAAVVRKLSREGENITGLVHCGQLTIALRVTN